MNGLFRTLVCAAAIGIVPGGFFDISTQAGAQAHPIFAERRARLAEMVDTGIVIIQSTERNQQNLLEFYVSNSDNHDFIFLTGIETPGSTLLLLPGSDAYPEVLYTPGDPEEARRETGIEHIYPPEQLLPNLSDAYSDFSQLRYTQRIRKELPSEIARVLYAHGEKKVVYFNFPRFVNLDEPPPERLEFIHRFAHFSPKYDIRDVSDMLDALRMYHDEYGRRQLREAVRITGEGVMDVIRSVTPGMTEAQLRAVFTFSCDFRGAQGYGFPTTIRSGSRTQRDPSLGTEKVMREGELVTIDCGAYFNHYTADVKRTFPVSGRFSDEQKRVYNILKKAHLACIELVKPGVTMKDLQEKAYEILDAEGGYAGYFRWGTSHFLGMEVHDHGDNLKPFKPGIAITVEPGITLPGFSVELEDDVLCTEDGHEWLSSFIPVDVEDIENLVRETGIGETFFKQNR